ncbi:C-type lectin 37Da-like [Drosophila bipectinata]|uniref:C-type lectin 37Da-like n=1 Tax=Drosophila bipectinata TaxID=42026 RepID=UPI001C8ABF68|nr:C-type lectin 37Da-like [Drosophila bipectinata]
MSNKLTLLLAIIGLSSQIRAFHVISNVEDGVVGNIDIETNPFIKIGNGYYYIETQAEKNWYDAFESCRRMDSHLVSFESIDEWKAIDRYLWDNKIDNGYWTSGSDYASLEKHEWFSTGLPVSLDIWAPGQPDNYIDEHCDEIGYKREISHQHRLNDLPCICKRRYICEASQAKTASFVIF